MDIDALLAQDRAIIASYAAHQDKAAPVVDRHYDPATGLSALRFGAQPPQLVFLHGSRLNAHTWDGVILDLESPALCLELPGHGHSLQLPAQDYTIRQMAERISDMLRRHLKAPVILVGHSLGGICAVPTTAALGPLVSQLVLIDSSPEGVGQPAPEVLPLHEGPASAILDSLAALYPAKSRSSLAHIMTRECDQIGPDLWRWQWDPAYFDHATLRRAERPALWAQLDTLAQPIHLLAGGRSIAFTARDRAQICAARPDLRVEVIETAGHNVHLDAPKAVARYLNALIADEARRA